MTTLEIKGCEECPHHRIEREEWMDDCFRIFCEHDEQTNTEGFTHKIKFGPGVHFNCPLEKPKIIECDNEDCKWTGTKEDLNFGTCPDCGYWL